MPARTQGPLLTPGQLAAGATVLTRTDVLGGRRHSALKPGTARGSRQPCLVIGPGQGPFSARSAVTYTCHPCTPPPRGSPSLPRTRRGQRLRRWMNVLHPAPRARGSGPQCPLPLSLAPCFGGLALPGPFPRPPPQTPVGSFVADSDPTRAPAAAVTPFISMRGPRV